MTYYGTGYLQAMLRDLRRRFGEAAHAETVRQLGFDSFDGPRARRSERVHSLLLRRARELESNKG